MKKLFLFFAALVMLVLASYGQQETTKTEKPYLLKVKMKETDCFRCVSGQITMRDLSEVADVEIVFNGLNEKTIEQFLKTNALEYVKGNEGFKIASDKEKYAKLNTIPTVSEGHLMDKKGNEIMVFQFRLDKPTQDRLKAIKTKGEALMQKEPTTLQTDYNNDGIKFSTQGNYYVLTNSPMNLCQIFNTDGKMIREIDGNLVDPADVFPELRQLDSALIQSIKSFGYYRSSVEDVFINGKEIWIGFTVSCPSMEDGQVSLRSPYQVLSYPLYDTTQDFKVIFDGRQNEVATMMFGHSNNSGNSLPFLQDVYVVSQKFDQEGQSIYTQAKCEVQDGILTLKDERPIHYPEFEQKDLLWYKPKLKDGMLNLAFTEYLLDIQKDTVFNLPFRYNTKVIDHGGFNIQMTQDALLVDWAFDGETLGVIYDDIVDNQRSKRHHLVWRKGQKDFTDTEITLPEEALVGMQLVLPDVACYLTTDNRVGTMVLE